MSLREMWQAQCEAALGIKEQFGIQKALGYLIGEKFLTLLRESDRIGEVRAEIPDFAVEIKRIFQPWEIKQYLTTVRRLGALGHTMDDESYEEFREADPNADDPVRGAEDVLLVERAKELLLD